MTRLLPLALVQSPAETLTDFAAALERKVKAHAVADLFVYPELHLNTVDSPGLRTGRPTWKPRPNPLMARAAVPLLSSQETLGSGFCLAACLNVVRTGISTTPPLSTLHKERL